MISWYLECDIQLSTNVPCCIHFVGFPSQPCKPLRYLSQVISNSCVWHIWNDLYICEVSMWWSWLVTRISRCVSHSHFFYRALYSGQGQPILSSLVFWTFPKPLCYNQIVSNKVILDERRPDLPYLPSKVVHGPVFFAFFSCSFFLFSQNLQPELYPPVLNYFSSWAPLVLACNVLAPSHLQLSVSFTYLACIVAYNVLSDWGHMLLQTYCVPSQCLCF